jgi:hypothetical protein
MCIVENWKRNVKKDTVTSRAFPKAVLFLWHQVCDNIKSGHSYRFSSGGMQREGKIHA